MLLQTRMSCLPTLMAGRQRAATMATALLRHADTHGWSFRGNSVHSFFFNFHCTSLLRVMILRVFRRVSREIGRTGLQMTSSGIGASSRLSLSKDVRNRRLSTAFRRLLGRFGDV